VSTKQKWLVACAVFFALAPPAACTAQETLLEIVSHNVAYMNSISMLDYAYREERVAGEAAPPQVAVVSQDWKRENRVRLHGSLWRRKVPSCHP
jgi:hypothetical protein